MMQMLPRLKRLIPLLALGLLLIALPVYAQEAAPASGEGGQTAQAPEGMTTLVLLLGLGALGVVVGIPLLRESYFKGEDDTGA
jgi:hypothetical protein